MQYALFRGLVMRDCVGGSHVKCKMGFWYTDESNSRQKAW